MADKLWTDKNGIHSSPGGRDQVFQQAYDAYARLRQVDAFPNQPEIVEWPTTELERAEQATLTAWGVGEAARLEAEAAIERDAAVEREAAAWLAQAQQWADAKCVDITITIHHK